MKRLACLSALLLLAALLAPGELSAHNGQGALIVVPADHIVSGRSFPVVASDLGPRARVSFRIIDGRTVVPLGSATARPNGHFRATFVLPRSVADGYVQLVANSSNGTGASTWVLVGERAESVLAPPGGTAWWQDRAVLALAAALLVGASAAGLAYRTRRRINL
jgi:hypothetical protein